jgi:peptidoglycan/LPS O-acetylase OafA/YrhL
MVTAHALAQKDLPTWFRKAMLPFADGDLGLVIFFVLSGYLITSILARERAKTGSISLRRFYARRALRIWPAFYVFLAVVGLLRAGGIVVSGRDLAASGLYVWNYAPHDAIWWVGHTWSLAVEEQFYLLWPLALVLIPRAWRLAIAVIAIEPFLRIAEYAVMPSTRGRIPIMFHTRADSLMFGCLIGLIAYEAPALHARLVKVAMNRAVIAGGVVFVFLVAPICDDQLAGKFLLSVGWTSENAAVGLLLLAAASGSAIRAPLSWRPLVFLGTISYGLYLWQQLFLTSLSGPFTRLWPLGVAAAVGCALVSYFVVEQPFLRLKQRFEAGGERTALPAASIAEATT